MKLGQLYDDKTGQFLDKTLFSEDVPEQFIKNRKEPIGFDTTGPNENTYWNLYNRRYMRDKDQVLSLLTGLVKANGTMKYLDQVNDNIYRLKVYLFVKGLKFSRTIKLQNPDLYKNVTLNRDYLANTSATHAVNKIVYGNR